MRRATVAARVPRPAARLADGAFDGPAECVLSIAESDSGRYAPLRTAKLSGIASNCMRVEWVEK